MSLDIVVCIKQVPHPEHFSRITLDPVKQTINREGIPAVINPLDRHAIEEALRLREQFSGKVTVMIMGPPQARSALEDALAMGADSGILLCDRPFAGADSLATARSLAYGVRKVGHFDLIFCGNDTIDSGTGQVGPQLAEFLDIPRVTSVIELALEQPGSNLIAKQSLEQGYMKVRVRLPALLAVAKGINEPRLATVWSIMEAKSKEVLTWCAADVGAPAQWVGLPGSPSQVTGIFERKATRRREVLEGAPEDIARKAIQRLKELVAK